jgi:hypothetical protein
LFLASQNQISNRPVCDVELCVPADVAAAQRRFASPTVQCEDPLFSIRILEVTESDRNSFNNVSGDGFMTAVVESRCSGIGVAGEVLHVFQWDALAQQISYHGKLETNEGKVVAEVRRLSCGV